MFYIFLITGILVLFFLLYIRTPAFGAIARGERLARIRASAHYQNNRFQNLTYTPDLTEGVRYGTVLWEFIFGKSKRGRPGQVLPVVKTDLHALQPKERVFVWLGHSSYFMQLDGKKILVDPVLSGSISPLPGTGKSFPGTDPYTADDLPDIDYLFITHDHWDHLDYKTVSALRKRVKKVITGLGTGAHLERWGFQPDQILEGEWHDRFDLQDGFEVVLTPARHFSGRGLRRNQVLWTSFVLYSPSQCIYLGGDSGYDTHFAAVGEAYGPFHLAILECGQYDKNWKYIHMMPEEVAQAARDLKAQQLLPVHWGKFQLANHAWDEPVTRLIVHSSLQQIPLLTPKIGEPVTWGQYNKFEPWWEASASTGKL